MDKSASSKGKDLIRTAGKKYRPLPSTWERRVTASGVTFGGEYISTKKKRKKKTR